MTFGGRVWSLSYAPHHRKTVAAVRTTTKNSSVNEMRKKNFECIECAVL